MHKQQKTDRNSYLAVFRHFSSFSSEKKKKDAKEEYDAKLVPLLWIGVVEVEVEVVGCCCCCCCGVG